MCSNEYIDTRTGQSMGLAEAVRQGLLDPRVARQVYAALGKESLATLIQDKIIDAKTGRYIHPETGRKMTLQNAIGQYIIY